MLRLRYQFTGVALLCLSALSCTIAPKGNYSRTHIDRPYTLNEDVAKVSFGVQSTSVDLVNANDSATGQTESDNYSSPLLLFENGVSDNFTWIFPIGLRWRIYNDEKNSLGISGMTGIFWTILSFDYWLRLSERFSLRPYARYLGYDFIFVEEERQFQGLEVLYQLNKYWSFSFYGHKGEYRGQSDLIDIIVNGLAGTDDFTSEVTGEYRGVGLKSLYSLNDRWDVFIDVLRERYYFDDFDLDGTAMDLGFNYYW